jgi:predicted membrane channel-forming protein YqfA (hemolysin III family)
MLIVSAIVAIIWWIAIWGLFDIYTEDKPKDEKIKIYLVMLGLVLCIILFFPHLINRL